MQHHAAPLLAVTLLVLTVASVATEVPTPSDVTAQVDLLDRGVGGGGGPSDPPAFKRNYQPLGAIANYGEEASPFYLNGRLYMMESVMGLMPPDGSQGAHSFFCVYDAATGEAVACPESSSAFAFCSAVVDHTAPPQRLWVFCSAWDRANHSYCGPQPPTGSWGCGACADAMRGLGGGCVVASWSTEDLQTWSGPTKALTLPLNETVPNVGVSMVGEAFGSKAADGLPELAQGESLREQSTPAATNLAPRRPRRRRENAAPTVAAPPPPALLVPTHQAFMAIENSNLPLAINTGTDRDLSENWHLLPFNRSAPACSRGAAYCSPDVACPTARYNPMDGFYYVFGGGNDITITRSRDLVAWEPRNMSIATHCIAESICLRYRPPCPPTATNYEACCIASPDCSAASGEGQIASGYFTGYWQNRSDCHSDGTHCRRDYLGNLSQWDWSVNDADFCDEGGKGPTRFIYAMCEQTAPRNASRTGGGGGYHMGVYPGNESQWLSSFY